MFPSLGLFGQNARRKIHHSVLSAWIVEILEVAAAESLGCVGAISHDVKQRAQETAARIQYSTTIRDQKNVNAICPPRSILTCPVAAGEWRHEISPPRRPPRP